jgi:hypothetical protein
MDDFEFKPLTEGLGFHRKAEKPSGKVEPRAPRFSEDIFASPKKESKESTQIYRRNSRDLDGISLRSDVEDDFLSRESTPAFSTPSFSASRSGSKSISDLIASLPPSLSPSIDFLNDDESTAAAVAAPRPQIFQPLARAEYKADIKPDFRVNVPSSVPGSLPGLSGKSLLPQKPILPIVSQMSKAPTAPALPVPTVAGASSSNSPYRERLDESFARAFPRLESNTEKRTNTFAESRSGAQAIEGYAALPLHVGAAVLDTMVVTGMSTFLMVFIVLITHVNLWGLMTNPQTDGSTVAHLVLLFVAVLNIYLLTARSFFSCSLGEWAFDLQVGTDADQKRLIYPLQVAGRTLALTFTGLIVLPILSKLFNRDLLKPITGLQLYHKT